MEDGDSGPSAEVQALAKEHRELKARIADSTTFIEKILSLLTQKERLCENLQADLEDQTESRRKWQKRAQDIESRIGAVQHVLVLVDGNQNFFKPELIRAGSTGAEEAVAGLLADVKEFARSQHENDLPENVGVVLHIFADIGKLALDLSAANLLPDPDQLWAFIQGVCKEPFFTISDCGPGHQAVDAKLKQFYELYVENCHCRHLFLALGPDAEYLNTLLQYSDDAYTMAKTSLVRPEQGFAPGGSMPFHTVDFSTFQSIPQDSRPRPNGVAQVNGHTSTLAVTRDRGLTPRPVTALVSATPPQENAGEVKANLREESLLHSVSTISRARPHPDTNMSQGADGESQNTGGDPAPRASSAEAVLHLESSAHSSSTSSKAAPQGWEFEKPQDLYAPAPIQGAWGAEVTTSTTPEQDQEDSPTTSKHPRPVTYGRGGADGSWRQPPRPARRVPYPPDRPAYPAGRVPQQFEGSWDEMVQRERPLSVASPPPAAKTTAAAKENGLNTSAFTRRVRSRPEPDPQARPVWSSVALNALEQRIDLTLPRAKPADQDQFEARTRNRKLCNEHHLRSNCHSPSCTYDHEEITDGVYLALRNKARGSPCSKGPECRRHDCYGSHHCPNVSHLSSCGRPRCPYPRRMHETKDLEVVTTIAPPSRENDAKSDGTSGP